MKVIYVAGKYTGKTYSEIDDNIRKAEKVSVALWRKGWAVITPHKNTGHFEIYEDGSLTNNVWIEGLLEILERCDAIFMMNDWEDSPGSIDEVDRARICGLDIYYEKSGIPDC